MDKAFYERLVRELRLSLYDLPKDTETAFEVIRSFANAIELALDEDEPPREKPVPDHWGKAL